MSAMSVNSDEGLDLSQRLGESLFIGPELDLDSEEIITGMSVLYIPVLSLAILRAQVPLAALPKNERYSN